MGRAAFNVYTWTLLEIKSCVLILSRYHITWMPIIAVTNDTVSYMVDIIIFSNEIIIISPDTIDNL